MTKQRISDLYTKYKQKTCSYAELEEWFSLLQNPESRTHVEQLVVVDWQQTKGLADEAGEIDWDFMFSKIIKETARVAEMQTIQPKARLFKMWRVAAAAVLLLVAGATLFLLLKDASPEPIIVKKQTDNKRQHQILPGREGAILTLANGTQIVLDSAHNGALTKEGNTEIRKENGQVVYDGGENSGVVAFNTMTTPRGRQYQLTLADGSKVWLNAASSVTFPTAFAGGERRVSITGEAYFEVVHDAAKPFVVNVNGMEVQVMGTHFNVNAYPDETTIKTTLVEGRVKVKKEAKYAFLNPGQQAQLVDGNSIRVKNGIDIDEVMAWKNGRFLFNSTDIETVLRQAARWYDVDVVYEGRVRETFSGSLPRTENIFQLLKIMEATEKVAFKVNGRQITVKPK